MAIIRLKRMKSHLSKYHICTHACYILNMQDKGNTHIDGDHQAHAPTLPAQLKKGPTKLKEVKDVAKIYRIVMAMPDELAPDSFNPNPVFVIGLVQDLVDSRLEGPHNILA